MLLALPNELGCAPLNRGRQFAWDANARGHGPVQGFGFHCVRLWKQLVVWFSVQALHASHVGCVRFPGCREHAKVK